MKNMAEDVSSKIEYNSILYKFINLKHVIPIFLLLIAITLDIFILASQDVRNPFCLLMNQFYFYTFQESTYDSDIFYSLMGSDSVVSDDLGVFDDSDDSDDSDDLGISDDSDDSDDLGISDDSSVSDDFDDSDDLGISDDSGVSDSSPHILSYSSNDTSDDTGTSDDDNIDNIESDLDSSDEDIYIDVDDVEDIESSNGSEYLDIGSSEDTDESESNNDTQIESGSEESNTTNPDILDNESESNNDTQIESGSEESNTTNPDILDNESESNNDTQIESGSEESNITNPDLSLDNESEWGDGTQNESQEILPESNNEQSNESSNQSIGHGSSGGSGGDEGNEGNENSPENNDNETFSEYGEGISEDNTLNNDTNSSSYNPYNESLGAENNTFNLSGVNVTNINMSLYGFNNTDINNTNITFINETGIFIEIDDLLNNSSNQTNFTNIESVYNYTFHACYRGFCVAVANASDCEIIELNSDNQTIYEFELPCGNAYNYSFNTSEHVEYNCDVEWYNATHSLLSDVPCSVRVNTYLINLTNNMTNESMFNNQTNLSYVSDCLANLTTNADEVNQLSNLSFSLKYYISNGLMVVNFNITNNTICDQPIIEYNDSNYILSIINITNFSASIYLNDSKCNITVNNASGYNLSICSVIDENLNETMNETINRTDNILSYLLNHTNGEVHIIDATNYSFSSVCSNSNNTNSTGPGVLTKYDILFDNGNQTSILFYDIFNLTDLEYVYFFVSTKFNSSAVFVKGNPKFKYAKISLSSLSSNGTVFKCDSLNLDNLSCDEWTPININYSYDNGAHQVIFNVTSFSGYTFNSSSNLMNESLNQTNQTINISAQLKNEIFLNLSYNQPSVLYGRASFIVNNPFDQSIPLESVFDVRGRLRVKDYTWKINGKKITRIPPNYNGSIELYAKFDKPNYRSPPNIDWKPKVIIPYNLIKEKYNLSYSLESFYSQDNTTLEATSLNTSMFNTSNVSNSAEININKTEIHDYLKQLIGTNFNITNSGDVEFIMTDWAWWNSTWGHKLKININNTMSSSLSNYQVKIVLNSSISDLDFDDFNSSCKDIRFLNNDEDTELDYWVEYCNVSSEHIEVWVNVPSLSASSITTIWMYYANDDVESTMNGTATFIKFDDFNDGSIDSDWTPAGGSWTESGGYLKQTDTSISEDKHIYQSIDTSDFIVETLLRPDYFGSDKRMGVCAYRSSTSPYKFYNGVIQWNDVTKINHLADQIRWGTPASTGFTYSTGNWYHFKMKIYANSSSTELYSKSWRKHYYEPSSDLIHNTWNDFSTYVAGLNGGQNSNVSFDYFFVHKYAEEEPIITFGDTYTTPACVNLSDSSTYWDKVVNSSGTYYINKNTTLCTDTYTINIGSSDKAIVINNTNILLDCNNSIIDGVDKEGFGIYSNYNQTNIRNCYVKRYGNGIRFNYSNSSEILNSYVENNTYNGIVFEYSTNVVVNNTNSSNNYDGIKYYYSDDGLVEYFNSVDDSVGMAYYFSNNVTFRYSTVENSTSTGIIITGDNNTVEHNTIQYVDGKGINIYYNSDYNTLYNNTITTCGNGIYVESTCTNNNITGNDVTNSSQNGIYFDSLSTSNTLQSNRFCYNNQSGGSYYDYYDADSNSESDTTCDTSSPSGICDNTCAYSGCVNLSDSSTWSGRVAYNSSTNTYYINDNVTLCQDTYNINVGSSDSAIKINASNIFLDCNGSTIDGSDDEGYGIYNNGHDFVNISNCHVYNYSYGIFITSGSNNTLTNNTASNNNYGIRLLSSSDNTLTNNTANNNTVPHNGYGISLDSSFSNILSGNTANSNNFYGIRLESSSNNNTLSGNTASNNYYGISLDSSSSSNTLTNNTASNNNYGIRLLSSSNNTLSDNIANSNNYYGISLGSSSNNTLTNNTIQENSYFDFYIYASLDYQCNNNITNNIGSGNRPILYYNTSVSLSDNHNISELILCNADYSDIDNITVSGSDTLKNNGILLTITNYTNITNSIINNVYSGIFSYYHSSNNLFDSINVTNVSAYAIRYYQSDNNKLLNSYLLNRNDVSGVNIYDSDSIIVNNTIIDNFEYGIYSSPNSSCNHIFDNNTIKDNTYGIYMYLAEHSNFTNNHIYNNDNSGIKLTGSTHNRIINNNISNNYDGIVLDHYGSEYSTNNYFENNTISNNNNRGISITDSSESSNTFNQTIVCNNAGDYDVYDSDSNTFNTTMCDSSSPGGICDYSCSGCVNLSDSFTYRDLVAYSGGRYYINGNTTLCQDSYHVSNSDNFGSNKGAITFNSSHIFLDCNNSEIYGSSTSAGVGISIPEPKNHNLLRNCIVHDYQFLIVLGKNGGSVGADYNTIDNCTVYNAGSNGISAYYFSGYNVINNSLVYNVSNECINFFGQSNYGEIHNTIVHDCSGAGIYLTDIQQTIRNVTIYNSVYGLQVYPMSLITDNVYNIIMYNISQYYLYDLPSATNLYNLTLKYNESEVGKIKYPHITSSCNVPDSQVVLDPYFVSVNASQVSCLNTSANITIYKNDSVPCSYIKYYRKDGFPSSWSDIINNGYMFTPGYHVCDDGTDITTFSVSDWSGYAAYNYTGCVNLSDPSTWLDRVVNVSNRYYINDNVTLCQDTYNIPNSDSWNSNLGAVILNDSHIYLDCNGSEIYGDYSGNGITVPNSISYDTIRDCIIHDYNIGIQIGSSTTPGADYNTVDNVTVYNCSASGIRATYYSNNNTVNNSLVYNISSQDCILFYGQSVNSTTTNCEMYNCGRAGLYLTDSNHQIDNVTIHDSQYGIQGLSLSGTVNIANSVMYNMSNYYFYGVNTANGENITLKHNASEVGKVSYPTVSSMCNVPSSEIILNPYFVSLNASSVSCLNTSANITIYKNDSVPCSYIKYYRKDGFPSSWSDIINNGYIFTPGYHVCDDGTDITTFSVSDWSGYAAYNYTGCVNLSDPSTYMGRVVKDGNDFYIVDNVTLCTDTYSINDDGSEGAIIMNDSDIYLDCNGSAIIGNSPGYGIYVNGFNNTIIKNCVVKNYSNNYYITGWAVNTTLLNDTSYYSKSLTLCQTNETNVTGFYVYDVSGGNRVIELGCSETGIINYNPYLKDIKFNNVVSGDYLIKGYELVGLELYNMSLDDSYSSTADIYLESTVYNSSLDYINLTNHPTHSTYGIFSIANNLTINRAHVNETEGGIYLYNAKNNTIENSVISHTDTYGLYISNSNDTLVLNSSFTYSQYGVKVEGNSHNLNITNSTMNHNQREGLWLAETATDNSIQDSTVCWNYRDTSNWYYDVYDYDSNTFTDVTCTRHNPDSIECAPCGGCVNLSDSSTWDPDDDGVDEVVNVSGTYYINDDVVLCEGSYNIADPDNDGAVRVNSSSILLDCNDAVLSDSDSGVGIYVSNISSSIIQNCIVEHYTYDIKLVNVSALKVMNNILRYSSIGVEFYNDTLGTSNNNIIRNNKIYNQSYGIALINGNPTLTDISFNNISNCSPNGILLYDSSNTTINNNKISYNVQGISLGTNSRYVIIKNNHIYNNSVLGIFDGDISSSSEILRISNNTIIYNNYGIWSFAPVYNITNNNITYNQKFAIYYIPCGSLDNFTNNLGGNGSQIYIMRIANSVLSDVSNYSEIIVCADNTTLTNITIDNGDAEDDGILVLASNVSIANLTARDVYSGIYHYSADNITINSIDVYNGYYGVYSSGRGLLKIDEGNIRNVSYGIQRNGGSNTVGSYVRYLVISNFTEAGLYFDNLNAPVFIESNNISLDTGSYGIYLNNANNLTIQYNYITGDGSSSADGIYMLNSESNYIKWNTINLSNNGLYLVSSTNNYFSSNNVTNSSQDGIYFDSVSTGNSLSNNRFCFNSMSGSSYEDYHDDDSNTESDTTCDTSSPSGICDNPCQYNGCINLSDSSTFTYDKVVNVSGHYYVNNNISLCTGTYYVNDPDNSENGLGVLVINASNIYVDFNASTLIGNGSGEGLTITNYDDIEIYNGSILNYSTPMYLNHSDTDSVSNMSLKGYSSESKSLNIYHSTGGYFDNITLNGSSDISKTIIKLDTVNDTVFVNSYFGEVNSTNPGYWWHIIDTHNLTINSSTILVPEVSGSEITLLTNSQFNHNTFTPFTDNTTGSFAGYILNSTFYDNDFTNVSLRGNSYLTIDSNRFNYLPWYSNKLIWITDNPLLIHNNITINLTSSGVVIFSGSNSNITGNNITFNTYMIYTPVIFEVNDHSIINENYVNGSLTGSHLHGVEFFDDITGSTVSNNEFHHIGSGIFYEASTTQENFTVYNNLFSSVVVYGIKLVKISSANLSNNEISSNDLGTGIYLSQSQSSYITNNTIANMTTGVYLNELSQSEVDDNVITNTSQTGLSLINANTTYLNNNNITYSGYNGIYIDSSSSSLTFTNTYSCYNHISSDFYFDINDHNTGSWSSTTCDTDNPYDICDNYCTPCVNLSDSSTWDPDGDGEDNIVNVSGINYVNNNVHLCHANYSLTNSNKFIYINKTGVTFDCDDAGLIGEVYPPSYEGIGIYVPVNDSFILNCYIKRFIKGVYISSSDNNHIYYNSFDKNEYGVYVDSDFGNKIVNNTFNQSYYYNIFIDSSSTSVCSDSIIENNTGDFGYDIRFLKTSGATLTDENSINELILCNADNFHLSNMTITGRNNNGLLGLLSSNGDSDNLTIINAYKGIYMYQDSDGNVWNNTLINDSKTWNLELGSNNTVFNQITIYDDDEYVYNHNFNTTFNDLTIANTSNVGKVEWENIALNKTQQLKADNFIHDNWFASLDSSSMLADQFNQSANITIYKDDGIPCSNVQYMTKSGFPTTRDEIISSGESYSPGYHVCDDGTDITTFSVSDWSGYTTASCIMNVTNVSMFHVPEYYNEFYDNTNLSCRAKATSELCSTLNLTFTWYINGTHNTTWDTTVSCANDTWCETDTPVNMSYVNSGDNWTCSVQASCTSCGVSSWRNSSTHHIYLNDWAVIYGNTSGNITMRDSSGVRYIVEWFGANGKNVIMYDVDSSFDYDNLQALSRASDGDLDTSDFSEADSALGLSSSAPDSITTLFGGGTGTPLYTKTFNLFGKEINNVPIINSTNSSNFVTGILWDTEGCSDCDYSDIDHQTLVFVTVINHSTGYYGDYDYEITIPEQLQTYDPSSNLISIDLELD